MQLRRLRVILAIHRWSCFCFRIQAVHPRLFQFLRLSFQHLSRFLRRVGQIFIHLQKPGGFIILRQRFNQQLRLSSRFPSFLILQNNRRLLRCDYPCQFIILLIFNFHKILRRFRLIFKLNQIRCRSRFNSCRRLCLRRHTITQRLQHVSSRQSVGVSFLCILIKLRCISSIQISLNSVNRLIIIRLRRRRHLLPLPKALRKRGHRTGRS